MKVREVVPLGGVLSITPEATIHDAEESLRSNHVTGLAVVDPDGRYIGVVTVGDVAHCADTGRPGAPPLLDAGWHSPVTTVPNAAAWKHTTVAEVMRVDVPCASVDAEAREVAQAIIDANAHRAVLLDEERRPIGMITTTDFTRLVASGALTE